MGATTSRAVAEHDEPDPAFPQICCVLNCAVSGVLAATDPGRDARAARAAAAAGAVGDEVVAIEPIAPAPPVDFPLARRDVTETAFPDVAATVIAFGTGAGDSAVIGFPTGGPLTSGASCLRSTRRAYAQTATNVRARTRSMRKKRREDGIGK